MPHAELAPLVDVVQRNCDLADARHAREKSMCTYLLDMREHFRWAAQLPLGAAPDRAQLSEWIAQREQSWELLPTADAPFVPLPLGSGVDPFDDDAANRYLTAHGWVYGAGIGLFGAPLFFSPNELRNRRATARTWSSPSANGHAAWRPRPPSAAVIP